MLLVREPLPVGRVARDQTAFESRSRRGVGQRGHRQADSTRKAGTLHALGRDRDGRGVSVRAVHRPDRGKPGLAAAVGFVEQPLPHVRVVAEPPVEPPGAAQQPRGDVACDHRGFDRYRGRTAQRVEKAAAIGCDVAPSGDLEHRGSERLLHRRRDLHSGRSVASAVERIARQVDRDAGLLAGDDHVHAQVGRGRVDARPTADALAEPVGDGVFDAHGGELGVAQRLVDARGVDGDGAVGTHVVLPRDLAHALVERVGALRAHGPEREQDARCEPRPQQHAVRMHQRAREQHSPTLRTHAGHAQAAQLIGEKRLHTARAGGETRDTTGHGPSRTSARCAAARLCAARGRARSPGLDRSPTCPIGSWRARRPSPSWTRAGPSSRLGLVGPSTEDHGVAVGHCLPADDQGLGPQDHVAGGSAGLGRPHQPAGSDPVSSERGVPAWSSVESSAMLTNPEQSVR